ncbi:MAG TPA: cytochrome P450, partial [Solirubrobacterales bacterium]|nr:cytochrome P450 [Solirubrobacterales bacterium]
MATLDSTKPVAKPPQMSDNPVRRLAEDLSAEWRNRGQFPPGPGDFSLSRTHQIAHDPLPILLSLYEEHGPIFSARIFHTRVVFMLGPEANHFITVAHPENFHWREGSFGDLIPLLGDGLLTIDGPYHRRARRIMLPAFHRERIAASHATMVEETQAAIERDFHDGARLDLYRWTRRLA